VIGTYPCDILAVRGHGFFSEGILRATGGSVSHVGLVIATSPVPLVIEALWRVKTRPLWRSIEDAVAAYLLHPLNVTTDQQVLIVEDACNLSAAGYGWWDIGLQVADAAFRTTAFTDHALWGLKNHPICSFLCAQAYGNAGLTFGMKLAQSITPADIFAFAVGNPDKYVVETIK
jgi:hypothetical protein